MTKTLVDVRRPAQCAYACTNKESRHIHKHTYTYIHMYIPFIHNTHLYTFAHFSICMRITRWVAVFAAPKRTSCAQALPSCRCPCPFPYLASPVPGVDLILVTSFGPSLLEHSFVRSFVLRVQCGKWGRFQVLRRTPAACCLLLDLLNGNDSVYLLYINWVLS